MANNPYIVDSFRGGISEEQTRGQKGSFKFGYALDIHKRRDSLSCGFAMQTVTSTGYFLGLPLFMVAASDGSTYIFNDDGRIYSMAGSASDPSIVRRYTDTNGKIKGAGEWQISDGSIYLFWCTDTSVSRKLLPGNDAEEWADVTQNWRTTLEPAEWHTIKPAAGVLAICNENFIATVDYSGNFLAEGVNLRPGNLAQSLEERDDYVIIGSKRRDDEEQGHIWSWTTTALNWIQKRKVPVKGVNAVVDAEIPILQGGSDGELFLGGFENSEPINSIPDGGKCSPGGATVFDDRAFFGIYGGSANPGLYSYGRRARTRPLALNYDYRLASTVNDSTVSTIGAVIAVNDTLYASWGTTDGSTSEYGIDQLSSTTRATARYESLEFDAERPDLKKNFQSLKLMMRQLPSGTNVGVAFRKDGESDWTRAELSPDNTRYNETNAVEVEYITGVEAKTFEWAVDLVPSGTDTPEITAVVNYLDDGTAEHG